MKRIPIWLAASLCTQPIAIGSTSLVESGIIAQSAPPNIDALGPPATLHGLWNAVVLVIHGRVEATDSPSMVGSGPSGGTPMIGRYHSVRVLEVLKNRPGVKAGGEIRLMQYGGTIDRDGKEISTEYPDELLEVHQEAIMFLESFKDGTYKVAHGRAGLLRLESRGLSRSVRIPEWDRGMPSFAGRTQVPFDEVLRELRSFRDAGSD